MGPPGGGRNSVTNRYLRHFSVISATAFSNDTLSTIFSALVDWWMKRAGFGVNVTKLAKPLVAASLEVYETIQKELLPTPTKSHYTFNLRDVSKVIQVEALTWTYLSPAVTPHSFVSGGPSGFGSCHSQSSKPDSMYGVFHLIQQAIACHSSDVEGFADVLKYTPKVL